MKKRLLHLVGTVVNSSFFNIDFPRHCLSEDPVRNLISIDKRLVINLTPNKPTKLFTSRQFFNLFYKTKRNDCPNFLSALEYPSHSNHWLLKSLLLDEGAECEYNCNGVLLAVRYTKSPSVLLLSFVWKPSWKQNKTKKSKLRELRVTQLEPGVVYRVIERL